MVQYGIKFLNNENTQVKHSLENILYDVDPPKKKESKETSNFKGRRIY